MRYQPGQIEYQQRLAIAHDDAVDRLLTWLVNGPARVPPDAPLYGETGALAPLRTDGVHQPGAPILSTNPEHCRKYSGLVLKIGELGWCTRHQ